MNLPAKKRKLSSKKNLRLEISPQARREIWGIFFLTLAVLATLALLGKLGVFGKVFASFLVATFGKGAFFFPLAFGVIAITFFAATTFALDFTATFGIFLLFFGFLGFFHTFLPTSEILQNAQKGGGWFGFAASFIFENFLGKAGARTVLVGIFLAGVVLTFPFSLASFFENVIGFFRSVFNRIFKNGKPVARKKEKEKFRVVAGESENEKKVAPKDPAKPLISKQKAQWEFPSLQLLSNERSQIFADEKNLRLQAEQIREKLQEFGVSVAMGPVHVGPTVTQFTLAPAEGVKISRITGLKNDLALALSAHAVRLEAPIPGKNLVGIEIPNQKRTVVHLREILESKNFQKIKSTLRLAFGRNVAGETISFDLAEMPHLLIAGATGAGKSVCMNTFLLSLLFQNSPADLKMILIDPKKVELAPFDNIPHLLSPVITDAEKALGALRWAVAEMMRRYQEMSSQGFRNIAEFNAESQEKMPKIIIVIDELADLMMRQLKKETENMICRLAQMARAVGMHLIIATQRPSVDVITGLIKANIPSRISFAVTSQIDSRTVLDSIGAEDLLGKGDMLFSNSALSRPLRVQGILVSREEVQKVVRHLKLTGEPEFDETVLQGGEQGSVGGNAFSAGFVDGGDQDDLLGQAIEIVRQSGKASASLLQRKLSVGYARAAKILDIMEEQGLIGPARGAKPREIFL